MTLTWGSKPRTMPNGSRRAEVERNTKETQIRVAVDLDGSGTTKLATGIGFLITVGADCAARCH